MRLDDYFETEISRFDEVGEVETIRLKGSRIAVEDILEPYLQGESAERIWQGYRHSLSLEQVYATITWYLHNKERVEAYLRRRGEVAGFFQARQRQQEPPEAIQRLREAKAQQQGRA